MLCLYHQVNSFSLLHVTFSRGTANQHGFHMLQAMRFTVEQINNGTRQQRLLPGVKLGYQLYDSCSISATMLATLDLLEYNSLTKREGDKDPNYNTSQGVLAVIGPDSSSKTFMPAFLLGSYLIPQVS